MSRCCPHPVCIRENAKEDYDASQTAALVAVNLISSARVILKLDSEFTEYSAQYLVDYVGKEDSEEEMDPQLTMITLENCLQYMTDHVLPKEKDVQGEIDQQRPVITVKDCLQFAFKKGLVKREQWAHLGCAFKPPPFACHIPRISMKGEVIEAKTLEEALELLMKQPVGARLHLFSPEFDRVEEEGLYNGPAGVETSYVGLRDVIMVKAKKIKGDLVLTVKICYKKKTYFVKVSGSCMFTRFPSDGEDDSQVSEPTGLLVDFCIPRLSIN